MMNRCCCVWILLFLFLGALGIGFIAVGEDQNGFSMLTGYAYKPLVKKEFNQAYQKLETRLDRFRTSEQKRTQAPLCDSNLQPTNKLVPKRFCDCLAGKKTKEYCETTFLRGDPGKTK